MAEYVVEGINRKLMGCEIRRNNNEAKTVSPGLINLGGESEEKKEKASEWTETETNGTAEQV